MSNPRRHRERRAGRRAPFRESRPRILVVCEGEYTEPEYLEGFRKSCRNPRVQIEIAETHGVPRTLVVSAKKRKMDAEAEARREKDDNLRYDDVWCVFDVDDHPKISDAKQMARDNDIKLAISNPCFELWLLLHFRDNPGMQHRDQVRRLLKTYVPSYDKHVEYATYSAGYQQAVTRAERLDQDAIQSDEPGRNPTTSVHRLTEIIRQ